MSKFQRSLSTFSSPLPPVSSRSSSCSNRRPLSVKDKRWLMMERTANEILLAIAPNFHAEKERMMVLNFIQAFPYGSVPLKTYLPDGDIDLTAITHPDFEDAMAYSIYYILKVYELNNFGFYVTNVKMIKAQVKIVKCTVNYIPVDISFNQVGGFSSLCFLEKVDIYIGREHFFKRSIALIKAWCYYESRIHGGSSGLISTYALETLVLHIINLFHSCLPGPLAVLYKFLEYYSSFQWDKYGISLNGLIALKALPEVVVERPVSESDMLLSEEFIQSCWRYFSIPIQAVKTEGKRFQLRLINIVDPLDGENNLGRSISRGNFYRIRNAFSCGYRKLRDILMFRKGSINAGVLKQFFANTLNCEQRLEMEHSVVMSDLKGDCMSSFQGLICGQDFLNYTLPFPIRDKKSNRFQRLIYWQEYLNYTLSFPSCVPNIDQNVASSENKEDKGHRHSVQSYELEDQNDFPSLCH